MTEFKMNLHDLRKSPLFQGLSNEELAETLFISENTVKTHVKRVLTKLEARDRAQAVVMAYEGGLMDL